MVLCVIYAPVRTGLAYLRIVEMILVYDSYYLRPTNIIFFQMLDSAVTILLEACHVSESSKKSFERDTPELSAKFWMLLQILLKNMLSKALRIQKSSPDSDQLKERSMNPRKLRELYRMSLKSSGFSDLQDMFSIWIA